MNANESLERVQQLTTKEGTISNQWSTDQFTPYSEIGILELRVEF